MMKKGLSMQLNALQKISTTLEETEARKAQEVQKFLDELAPAAAHAERRITEMETFYGETVAPFLAQYGNGRVYRDSDLHKWLDELKRFPVKAQWLRERLKDLSGVTFEHISAPPYTDRIFPHKREQLIQRFRSELTTVGNPEGEARRVMKMFLERVELLARHAMPLGDTPIQQPEEKVKPPTVLCNTR